MPKKRKDIFKNLVGLEGGNKKWRLGDPKTRDSEKWIFHILSADREAPKIESERNIKPFIIISIACLVLFSLIISRAAYLQIFQGGEFKTLAEENRNRGNIIRAPRGIIYDRNHAKLVKNVPNYEATVIPSELPRDEAERERVISEASAALNIPAEEIKSKVNEKGLNYTQPIMLKESISKEDSFIVSSKMLKGISVPANPVREYLDGGLLSHALGYVGRISEEELKERKAEYMLTDYIGKTGLEESYEKVLRGKDGRQKYEVDSTGKVVKFLGEEEPKLGNSIVLSIDFELQKKMAEVMQGVMGRVGATKATAVAMDPRNGEILAFVNLPSYDNNLFSKGISGENYSKLLNDDNKPLLPRAVSGEYPSGSSIKPFVAAGALQEGLINENTSVNSTGGIKIGEWEFPDWKKGGHGITNVTKAIAESVNTFFYAIGGGYGNIQGLGPEKMKHYLGLFGFGKDTGIDIGGELHGSIPDPVWKEKTKNEDWYLGDTYHMAIGQGDILVTPLQINNATCAIANGGTLFKPHFVKDVVDENDKVLETKQPETLNQGFISVGNIEILKRGMRQTVTAGSARSLGDLPVAVSGKTGTAQFGPDMKKYHGWFTSFAPYDNPEIAITILVEGSGGGDETAVPIAKEVYRWYFSR
ncbi:penicillin-binding protein 2 [candidate division WS5 bacterium]|uniref:Penicillin-binding protein 2 n=1 Tax=candidate division WS5 bacterium TaxID=2093353 RepID=A0A419DEE1_9BACT|nr:MAG: penicillin-binding protein 2 [candidate division WS5 bacterium]